MNSQGDADATQGNPLQEAKALLLKSIELMEQAGCDLAAAQAQMALDTLAGETSESDQS